MTDLDDSINTLANSLRVLDKSARYVRNLYVTETLIFCALLDYLPEMIANKIARRYAPRWETLHDFQHRLTRLVLRIQARL